MTFLGSVYICSWWTGSFAEGHEQKATRSGDLADCRCIFGDKMVLQWTRQRRYVYHCSSLLNTARIQSAHVFQQYQTRCTIFVQVNYVSSENIILHLTNMSSTY